MRIISLDDARARRLGTMSRRPHLPSYADVVITLAKMPPDTIVGRYPLARFFDLSPLPTWAQAFTFLVIDQGPARPLTARATLTLLRMPVVLRHVGMMNHEDCYAERNNVYCPVVSRGYYLPSLQAPGVLRNHTPSTYTTSTTRTPLTPIPAYRQQPDFVVGLARVREAAGRLASMVLETLATYGTLHTGLPVREADTPTRRSA